LWQDRKGVDERMISCYSCRKYPLCRAYTAVTKINDEGYWESLQSIRVAIAKQCKYFDEVKE
jgi:hypothetical protein